MNGNGRPGERELRKLEAGLEKRGWSFVGYTPSGRENIPGVYTAERPGTSVVTRASASSAGLLQAVESFEAQEHTRKDDVHDVRRGEARRVSQTPGCSRP